MTLSVITFFFLAAKSAQIPTRSADERNPQEDLGSLPAEAPAFPRVFLRDVVVSNTDHALKNTDKFFNSEPGIAVNPLDPRKIVIPSFSGAWSGSASGSTFQNAPVWYTQNFGRLWTKEFTIPAPPGVPASAVTESPCDETFDYGRNGVLYGTFLLNGSGEEGANCSSADAASSSTSSSENQAFGAVYSGATNDPASAEAWQWLVLNGQAKPTNQLPPDQPWIVADKDPTRRGQDRCT